MKRISSIVATIVCGLALAGSIGCDAAQAENNEVKADAAKEAVWGSDFAKAQEAAKTSGKPILAFFTGSDWCGWCIRLHKEVLGEKPFADYASESLVLFEADFPRGKKLDPEVAKQNDTLMEKYGVRGFPTLFLLSADGKVLGQTGYRPGGADKYVEHLKELIAAGNK